MPKEDRRGLVLCGLTIVIVLIVILLLLSLLGIDLSGFRIHKGIHFG